MYINEENLLKVVKIMKDYFSKENTQAIAMVGFPEEIKYKSNDWLVYMFYSCVLDYGMRSKIYHSNLIHTYHHYPFIFDPTYVVNHFNCDQETLFHIIKENIHPRYPKVALHKWLKLSVFLSQCPSLLEKICSFHSYQELSDFIITSKNYGQKTGGLLLRVIYEANIGNFKDDISFIPIDRHDIEISYLNGVIEERHLTAKQIAELSTAYINISNKLSVNPSDVDKFLWEIGNRYCNRCHCSECPLYGHCKTKSVSGKE